MIGLTTFNPLFSPAGACMPLPADQSLSEDRRREIFLVLVNAQDQEMSVEQSRKLVAEQFDISQSQVRTIEREGIERQWPPL
jgi:hypothetical protein